MNKAEILAGLKTAPVAHDHHEALKQLPGAPKASERNRRYLAAEKRRKGLQEAASALRGSDNLWVPPAAARELVQRRHEYEQKMVHMMQMKHTMDEFNAQLREIDPYLQLVKAEEKIEPGHPLRPGFWHVIRHNPGAPPSVMTIEGEHGEYMEPTSRVFELLQKNDMWNSNSLKEENRRRKALKDAEDKRTEQERTQRQNEMTERWLAATRTQVSMVPGWSQNVAGKRSRK